MHNTRVVTKMAMLLFSLAAVSCGGDIRFKPVYPVRGQVFFEGKPAKGAAVTFHAVNVEEHPWTRPSAEVDENGDFIVSTYNTGDGMPVGTYEVTLVWLPPNYMGPVEKGNKLPLRYMDRTKSGYTVEIKPTDNALPAFQLTK